MKIYLIRHTTVSVEKSICYGQSDVGLADSFNDEAATALAKLPDNISDYKLYSSPLKRCTRLARKIAEPILIEDFKEINFGSWEMTPWENFSKEQIDHWNKNILEFAPPEGESFQELVSRVSRKFNQLCTEDKCDKIIVTHSMPIRVIIAEILGIPYENIFRLRLNYGSVVNLIIEEEYRSIEFL